MCNSFLLLTSRPPLNLSHPLSGMDSPKRETNFRKASDPCSAKEGQGVNKNRSSIIRLFMHIIMIGLGNATGQQTSLLRYLKYRNVV